mgnify:CR=1 FL=1
MVLHFVSRVTGTRILNPEVHVIRLSKLAATAASATLAVGVFSAAPASANEFYNPPSSLPGANGTVIKTERIKPLRISAPVSRCKTVVEAGAGSFERWNLKVGDVIEVSNL